MTESFDYDVFISHSSMDKAVARELAERLREDGLRVWLEEWVIRRRVNRHTRIEAALEGSRVLVFCMSGNASGPEWVEMEAGTFQFRDPLNPERRLVPLRFDDTPIPDFLRQHSIIDWREGDRELSYAKLLEACRAPKTGTLPAGQAAEVTIKLDSKQNFVVYAFSSGGASALTGMTDGTLQLWDIETGRCMRVLEGHSEQIWRVSWSVDHRLALSGSWDNTVRLWDIETGRCLHVLEGHSDDVCDVAWSADGRRVLTGSDDYTIRLWDIETERCLRVIEGHTDRITSAAWSANQRHVLTGMADGTLQLWDIETERCLRVLEGHTEIVRSIAWSADQRLALSGSNDSTIRLWDIERGRCLRVLEGHTSDVGCVAWSADEQLALSGSNDGTVRLWDMASGRCLRVFARHSDSIRTVAWSADQRRAFTGDWSGVIKVWDLSEFAIDNQAPRSTTRDQWQASNQVQYTNAKVLLVGESGAGKTGLTERLAHNTFTPSYSTSGAWSTQWRMNELPVEPGWEREVWLWDFGGQADQRLIHQLYVDKASLVLLVFNADRDAVLPGLREWRQALSRSVPDATPTYLIAGRIDAGFRVDRQAVQVFAQQEGYKYFETSAFDGRGRPELLRAIQEGIPWDKLERRTSPVTWKLLKDEILRLRDEGHVLFTFKELRETLRQRLAVEVKFTDAELETVLGLLDGPGVVKELNFGTYILLRPEWINAYAQAVIRTLRADPQNLGCLPVQSIAEGNLIFQSRQVGDEVVDEGRLVAREEQVVLQAMEQTLLERNLCLRQEGNLVFPSYCGVEKPIGPVPPKYFIRYDLGGFLDDIYATLVVKLVYCGAFRLRELWRDAADFETLADHRTMGIKLLRNDGGQGTLLVHVSSGVPEQEQVIFANYIHRHLDERALETQRLRLYVCRDCDAAVKDSEEAMRRLEEYGETATILCQRCEHRIPLWDSLEKLFAGEEMRQKIASLERQERQELDSRRKGKLLALEVAARITSANQKCFEIPGVEDEGIDMEVEFTDAEGRGTGKRFYLQLKSGNSYLKRRMSDGAEIFRIEKQRWVDYWLKQPNPVLLVIGTFPKESASPRHRDSERFADIRWMEISDLLRRESRNGTRPVHQIVFKGQRLDTMAVRRWRVRALS